MLKVYEAEQVGGAEQVRDMLERRGIEARVFGEYTYGAPGINPLAWPAVWVMDDEDFDAAKSLIREYEEALRRDAAREPDASRRWHCRHCGEWNEETFALCWKCSEPSPD